MKKAIVTAGSRGIGKAIADSLSEICDDVVATSSQELDTSDLDQVNNFIKNNSTTDILVLNTGGPPAKLFNDIGEDDWNKYHNQLFLSFCLMLQRIHVNDGGYIFLMSSFNIKEPDPKLILSNSYRIAMTSVLKSLSKSFAARDIACINIAPGPIKTDRLYSLVDDMEALEKTLPMRRVAAPEEIGVFVKTIIQNNIKYMTGVTINFDGGASNYIL
jgi:3-oxoacyl-[acyl-carrier protein] reductase